MSAAFASLADLFVKSALVMLAMNEIRGLVLAGPVLYGMYQAGGTLMAIWIGFCSLAGVGLSVVVPMFAAKRLGLLGRLRRVESSQ
jgi:hypothetical protein